MIFTTDDVCPSNLGYFKYWKIVKESIPDLKLYCFTIAFNNEHDVENVSTSTKFKEWFDENKDWIEIGVHGYDHDLKRIQEGWRTDQEDYIKKSIDLLADYLPERFLYRAPGFRFLPKTESVLKKLGVAGIAHQEFIKYFDTNEKFGPLLNTHCCSVFDNPITEIWKKIVGSCA